MIWIVVILVQTAVLFVLACWIMPMLYAHIRMLQQHIQTLYQGQTKLADRLSRVEQWQHNKGQEIGRAHV